MPRHVPGFATAGKALGLALTEARAITAILKNAEDADEPGRSSWPLAIIGAVFALVCEALLAIHGDL